MSTYTQRLINNIIPLSVEKENVSLALKEWAFTGKTQDNGRADEICGLCDQENIRYQFLIDNQHTSKSLWVGSSCILKFDLDVIDTHGRRLNKTESKRYLNELTKAMQYRSCIKALEVISTLQKTNVLSSALAFYRKNHYLTPNYASVVFWQLKKHSIEYHPSFFKISIKKNHYKDQFRNMEPWRLSLIWPALSSSQKRTALEYGCQEPT